jgi:hypothetical protein
MGQHGLISKQGVSVLASLALQILCARQLPYFLAPVAIQSELSLLVDPQEAQRAYACVCGPDGGAIIATPGLCSRLKLAEQESYLLEPSHIIETHLGNGF